MCIFGVGLNYAQGLQIERSGVEQFGVEHEQFLAESIRLVKKHEKSQLLGHFVPSASYWEMNKLFLNINSRI